MLKLGICFCKPGVMSQCTAKNLTEQRMCDYWNKSIFADRCMNRNESMNNHCWDHDAQKVGYLPPDISVDYDALREPKESPIDRALRKLRESVDKSCTNCLNNPCSVVFSTNRSTPGGISYGVMIQLAEKCASYIYGGD